MSIRTFLFCDVCNPRGIRCPEQRRDMRRKDLVGRRITDGRAWYGGNLEQALLEDNWVSVGDGFYVCPSCVSKGLTIDSPHHKAMKGLRTYVFCDFCNPQCFRFVEIRRNNRLERTGRRVTDGRSWLDPADKKTMLERNWVITVDDKHYCELCIQQRPSLAENAAP